LSGAAVPGASVKLTQTETNLTREIITNATGSYVYNDAPAGTYQITVSKEGFQVFTTPNVTISSWLLPINFRSAKARRT
jgi:uncharacterized surface anchored protein